VSRVLGDNGALVLDADEMARGALAPGTPGARAVRERFGDDVVGEDGALDRARLAAAVFADTSARSALEAIVHPVVHASTTAALERARRAGGVVVLDSPLLVETDGRRRYGLDAVLVVDAPDELVVERLVRRRAMSVDEVRARLAAQATRGERVRAADYVIVNIGTLDELVAMAEEAWRWIARLPGDAAPGRST
jgi:dephospho-CoA kinase